MPAAVKPMTTAMPSVTMASATMMPMTTTMTAATMAADSQG